MIITNKTDREIKDIVTEAVLNALNDASDASSGGDRSWLAIEAQLTKWFQKVPSMKSNISKVSDEKEAAGSTHKIVIHDKRNNAIKVASGIAEPYAKKILPHIANLISVLSGQQVKDSSTSQVTFS
jgi:hypothetical protein